jgi:phage minor structural protein
LLYLLNKDVRTVRWNGEPLHEATSAIVKETMNSDFTLTVKYPISDSGIYQLIQEDMLIKAPTPVLGAQLFRIKKPVEHNDHLEITAYHISDDVMQRSITPVSVTGQSCGMALSRMVQNTKTALGDFSFNSDIQDRRTFNTTETETLYSVLLDGKHSIVGTWEGELVRDNFAMTIKKSRGENRGVVITTHKSLKDYQRTKNSQNVVTRIHAKSTFKPEGAEKETTIRVTVDSPLINSYPYINEKEYENNNAKSAEELQKWAQAKFSNEGIDKVSDAVKIEAYELDGQVVHMGDTVNLKSWKHNVDAFKKAIAYEFDALKEEYISLTFDDKAGTGGSRASGGLSSAADAILGVTGTAQEIALEKALQNADLDFDHQAGLLRQEILDGIELARAKAEEVKRELSDTINQRFDSFDNASIQEAKRRAEEALRNAGASSLLAQEAKRISLDSIAKLEAFKSQATSAQTALSGDLDALKRTVTSEVNQASEYRRTTTEALSRMTGQMNGFATKSEVRQDVAGLTETFAKLKTDTNNLISGAKSEITLAKTEFQKTADGLSAKMLAVESYVGQDGQRQEALRRYTREESARQATAVREQISRDYVGKSTYQEDVRGLERRFSAISTQTNNDIATKIAQYKQTVDGQFASITSQIANKANQTDFQRVQETSRLYERIIGSNENDISNKVARMALTNQLFQVEVSKYASQGGPNLIKNSGNPQDNKNWGYWEIGQNPVIHTGTHPFFYNQKRKLFFLDNRTRETVPTSSIRFSLKRNTSYTVSLTAFNTWNMKGSTIYFLGRKSGENQTFTRVITLVENVKFSSNEAVRKNYTFNSGECDEGFIRIDNNGTNDNDVAILLFGDVDVYEGTVTRPWQPSPEDTNEAVRSVQSQLAGSWSVQNINSAGDLISGINLGANGHNRFDGKLTHITGETLIDRAVIKSAMIDKLKTANFEAGSVTTVVLDAEAVTAEKLKVDQALFNKLVANEAYLSQLFAKQAFINRVQSVAIDASQVRSGILSGDRIYGGTIRGANIFGGTLTGHTKIQLGAYGSFDTVNGGLQINVPRDYNAKDGLGVQFIGSYGRGENVPYGLFIYKDSDFTTGGYASRSDDFLLTVEGYIKANGIGWFKTGKGSINGSSTATIGYWNSSVSLDFGGSGNDIYYSYNGKAYSLWTIVNKHFSDRRLKDNIVDCRYKALDYIQQFKFKEYDWKKQEDRPRQAHTKIGLIAQEVQAVDPTLVYENGDTLNLDNLRLTNIALKAIQELALENKTLTQRLENLENERRTA